MILSKGEQNLWFLLSQVLYRGIFDNQRLNPIAKMKTFHVTCSLKRCILHFSLRICKEQKKGRIKAARRLGNLGEKGEEQNQRGKKEEQKKLTQKKESKEYPLKTRERLASKEVFSLRKHPAARHCRCCHHQIPSVEKDTLAGHAAGVGVRRESVTLQDWTSEGFFEHQDSSCFPVAEWSSAACFAFWVSPFWFTCYFWTPASVSYNN